ncbi:MAG: adenylate/guanylate cyclase domain-containing protein [Candidatus Magasanikbacteria bacterium]|nr:adenylate/guanylate cyclase domain-containing protein [Candidatus Magasanikbacteria bacterium]
MKQRLLSLAGMLIVCALCVISVDALGLFHTASSRLTDAIFLHREPDSRLLVVAIDDASLSRIGRWPWDRSVHAELVRRLSNAGARVIALDINFPENSTPESDAELARAIQQAGNVVLPIELSNVVIQDGQYVQEGQSVKPISSILGVASASGFTNLPLDSDNVARRLPVSVNEKDGSQIYGFAAEALRIARLVPALNEIPTDRSKRFIINYPGQPGVLPRLSAADILQGSADLSVVKDKIVFVGATARDLHDEQLVPTSGGIPMSGVEIHASIADTLLTRLWLKDASFIANALSLLMGILLIGFSAFLLRPRYSVIALIVIIFGYITAGFLLFDKGILLGLFWPVVAVIAAYMGASVYRFVASEQDKSEIKQIFGRYVSPSVVESLMMDPSKIRLGGERRRMTVLFSDLRGFTTLSESLTPEQLVEVLNMYLDEMTKIVFAEGGVLDKYIGDAVMAFWNAPMTQEDHAARAVRCSLAMKKRLQEMNEQKLFPNGVQLRVGIGMNTGEMVVGNIGSSLRHDYTVIGDSVNLASRTESLCKDYGSEIIVTKNTLDELQGQFLQRELDQVAVKGKTEPVKIHEIINVMSQATDAEKERAVRYSDALSLYYQSRFSEARRLFNEFLELYPSDVPAKLFFERCSEYEANPPGEGWDGTFVRKTK